MTVTLLGYNKMSFKADDGRQLEGTSIYYSYPTFAKNGYGVEAEKKFVAADFDLPPLIVGDTYEMDFSSKGRLLAMRESTNDCA